MGRPTAQDRHLEELLEPTVEAMGFELVRVRLTGAKRRVLQIMAERPDGTMDVEDCAELSRALSAVLDVEDPVEGEFVLEVSSPGIDRPLTRLKDFVTWAGSEAKLELAQPVEGRRRFKGRLEGTDGDQVLIAAEDAKGAVTSLALPFADLSDARLVLTDDLIRKAQAQAKEAAKASGAKTVGQGQEIDPDEDVELTQAGRRKARGR